MREPPTINQAEEDFNTLTESYQDLCYLFQEGTQNNDRYPLHKRCKGEDKTIV